MVELKPIPGTDYFLWKYVPSVAASIVALSLFSGFTAILCWRIYQTKTWFCIPFALGGLFQIVGYATRILCTYHTDSIAAYAVQGCFIVIAPIFYAASIYMTLGRIIRSVHGDHLSIIQPSKMTTLFVLGDFIALNIQGAGPGLSASRLPTVQTVGKYVVVVGLLFQLVMFGAFMAVEVVFHVRMNKYVTECIKAETEILAGNEREPRLFIEVPWQQGLGMLYTCSVLIVVRSIVRVIEYILGPDGYILAKEWPLYAFDAALMLGVQAVFLFWLPYRFQERCQSDDNKAVFVERAVSGDECADRTEIHQTKGEE